MVDYKWYRYASVSVYKFEGIEADSIDEAKDFVIEEVVSKMGKQPTQRTWISCVRSRDSV